MRFKAKLLKEPFSQLLNVVSALQKVQSNAGTCVVHLSDEKFDVVVMDTETDLEVQAFASLTQERCFADYRIESRQNNCISFEVSMTTFLQALQSGRKALEILLKLVKRSGQATLCFEIRGDFDVTHDIPIRLLKSSEIEVFQQPRIVPPQVQLQMPGHKFRSVIDRMKTMARYVLMSADGSGNLSVGVEVMTRSVSTFYKGLEVRTTQSSDNKSRKEDSTKYKVKVDIRKFSRVLAGQGLGFHSTLCISEDCALVVHMLLHGSVGSLTYFIPVFCVG